MIKNVGKAIEKIRVLRGLTIRQLAKRCGLSHTSIVKMEKGDIVHCDKSVNRIAKALNVPAPTFYILADTSLHPLNVQYSKAILRIVFHEEQIVETKEQARIKHRRHMMMAKASR